MRGGYMNNIQENEQWKLNGDCSKCRRQKYCSKKCTINQRRLNRDIQRLITNKMNEMTGGAYSEIMSHLHRKG